MSEDLFPSRLIGLFARQKNVARLSQYNRRDGTFQIRSSFTCVNGKPMETNMKKYLIPAAIAAFVFTAQTAVAAEYYVVRDATTKKCTVVDAKPTTTTTTIVDNGTFKTKTEAESGMKTTKVCTEH